VNPDRQYKIKVLVVSNKPEDRHKNDTSNRKLIANTLQTITSVKIPQSQSVAEVLAPASTEVAKTSSTVENASTEISNDIGARPCPFCDKSDSKSNAGLANHIRFKHK
jgi:hypothetical protein